MALVFIDGFDHYNVADIGKKWSNVGAGAEVTAAMDTGRIYGQSYKLTATGTSAIATPLLFTLPTPGTTGGIGFALKIESLSGAGYANACLVSLWNAAAATPTGELLLLVNSDGTLSLATVIWTYGNSNYLGSGGTVLGTGGLLVENEWAYIEFKWVLADSGGSASVCINGIEVITVSNADTMTTGPTCTSVVLGGWKLDNVYAVTNNIGGFKITNGTSIWIDDVYLFNDEAGITDVLGDVTVSTKLVTANGTTNNGTASAGSNFQCVDELLADTADYVTIADVDDLELYETETVGAGTVIHAVQVTALAQRTEEGSAALTAEIRQGGANYAHPTPKAITSDYSFKPFVYENDALDDPWTDTVFNAAEFGVKKTE